MQCKCGGNMAQSSHTITTANGLSKWTEKTVKLPVRIDQDKRTCTRARYTVVDCDGVARDKRG